MSIQLIIIIIYFILTVVIGLMSGRKTKSAAAFTGVALSTFAIVCASTGEWLGGTATTGVSEYGFRYGLSGWWYTIANGIGVLFLGLLFAKLFRSLETGTVPGIIEKFFGVKARTVSCIILTIVMLAVGLSQMIAAGKLGESLLGIPFWISAIAFAVIFIVYTLAGGMNAVASTNVMHLIVMYVGVIIAMIIAVTRAGGLVLAAILAAVLSTWLMYEKKIKAIAGTYGASDSVVWHCPAKEQMPWLANNYKLATGRDIDVDYPDYEPCHRLFGQHGQVTRCSEVCPNQAILFGDLDDPASEISKYVAEHKDELEQLKTGLGLGPAHYYRRLPKPFICGEVICNKCGEDIKGAKITAKSECGCVFEAETDFLGDFEVRGLPTNKEFTVTIEAPGFQTRVLTCRTNAAVNLGEIYLEKI